MVVVAYVFQKTTPFINQELITNPHFLNYFKNSPINSPQLCINKKYNKMQNRINISKMLPNAYKAMLGMENYIATTQLKPIHKELIKIRASQINGCAYCLDMHTRDARKLGETEQRLYLVSAWKETRLFTEEERVILQLTEEVTLISHHVSDETYAKAIAVFDASYLAEIVMMIIVINMWNRMGVFSQLEF